MISLICCICSFIHQIDRVIHVGDEIADIGAIERRDKSSANSGKNLTCDIVGLGLEPKYLLAIAFDALASPQ
jgi:hypothetical protein